MRTKHLILILIGVIIATIVFIVFGPAGEPNDSFKHIVVQTHQQLKEFQVSQVLRLVISESIIPSPKCALPQCVIFVISKPKPSHLKMFARTQLREARRGLLGGGCLASLSVIRSIDNAFLIGPQVQGIFTFWGALALALRRTNISNSCKLFIRFHSSTV